VLGRLLWSLEDGFAVKTFLRGVSLPKHRLG